MLRAAWRFRARGWYRRPPFLPVPPADYIAWRLHTAYGDEGALPPAADLGRYLEWSARFRRDSSHGSSRGGRRSIDAAGEGREP